MYLSLLIGKVLESLPKAELSFSQQASERAKNTLLEINQDRNRLPLMVYPDASAVLFGRKRWATENYGVVLREISQNWMQAIEIILLTGVDHPEETDTLDAYLNSLQVEHKTIGKIEDLGDFAALIAELGKRKAVLLGTESLVAGHLAPILDVWSVVLGWNKSEFHNVYRPVELGSTLLEDHLLFKPHPRQVIEALDLRINQRLQNKI